MNSLIVAAATFYLAIINPPSIPSGIVYGLPSMEECVALAKRDVAPEYPKAALICGIRVDSLPRPDDDKGARPLPDDDKKSEKGI